MSTKACFHSTQAAWSPGGPKPEKPSGSLPKAAGVPGTAQHRYPALAPRGFGFLLQQQKIHIPMVLAKSSVGRRGPEKGLTYGHCKRKSEKLKKEKKSAVWSVKGRVLRWWLLFVIFLQQFHFWGSKICKCYVKAFSKWLDEGFLLLGCCTPGTHWDGRIKIN